MKNIILISAVLLLFSSCSKKWCSNHYPCVDSISIVEKTILDTTWVHVPSDTTYIETPIDCPDQQVIFKEGKKETVIKIKDKILYVNQTTKDDSIRIINKFKQTNEFKQAVKEIPVIEYKTPRWNKNIIISLFILVLWSYRKYIVKFVRVIFKI